MTGPASELRNKGNKKKKTRRHEPAEYYCAHSMSLIALKLKLVHLHGYSSAFLHTRTRTAFPSACTLVPVGHTVRPGLVWFNTYLPVYLSTPYTIYSPQCNFVFFLFFLFLFFIFFLSARHGTAFFFFFMVATIVRDTPRAKSSQRANHTFRSPRLPKESRFGPNLAIAVHKPCIYCSVRARCNA